MRFMWREQQETVIVATVDFVKETLADAESGHDWWHIWRVWQLARHIAQTEKVDSFVVELGALLHDIADAKFHDGDETVGPRVAKAFLRSQGVVDVVVTHIAQIIAHISFKGERHTQTFRSPELDVVQDADRLDAMGAIGIARAFSYGGYKGREMYNPTIAPHMYMTAKEYRKNTAPTINHFYEKLLLLKDRMNTRTGRSLAERRHIFMERFLEQFYAEWKGEI